jgi:hypothetical protein
MTTNTTTASQPNAVQSVDHQYRVGWFWSSANPSKQVRCLAEGAEIAEYEKRGDFIRWCDVTPQPIAAAHAVPETQHQRDRRVIGEAMKKAKEDWTEMLSERSDRMDWFMAWFMKNYPSDTVISDPAWHGPRILAAAEFALKNHPDPAASPSPAAPKDAQGAVPEGWKLVPIEPTEAMLHVAYSCGRSSNSYERYAAFLAAAPLAQPTDTTKGA